MSPFGAFQNDPPLAPIFQADGTPRRRAVDPEAINRDTVDRRLLRVMLTVAAIEKGVPALAETRALVDRFQARWQRWVINDRSSASCRLTPRHLPWRYGFALGATGQWGGMMV
jgi:hypothetical protein